VTPPPLLVIAGPTCTGKTALAVEVAVRSGAAEIVNADSRQVRAGLHVGTCAPAPVELRGVPAHLFGVVAPGMPFTAADWLTAARQVIAEIRERGRIALLVGGTGLYVRALLRGYQPAPPPDPAQRERRDRLAESEEGRQRLAEELRRREPRRWERLDPRNTRRVIRALESLDAGQPPAVDPGAIPTPRLAMAMDTDRDRHAAWVRQRSQAMLCTGRLQAETRAVLEAGVRPADLAACGIGYAEAIEVLGARLPVDEAVEAVTRRTLRYARQQRTFFRGEEFEYRLEASRPVPELAAEVLEVLAGAG
jgi:tRNA dimethylallyltransferase